MMLEFERLVVAGAGLWILATPLVGHTQEVTDRSREPVPIRQPEVGISEPAIAAGPSAEVPVDLQTQMERAADVAAKRIPEMIAQAPERGAVPPRTLFMPSLTPLYPADALQADQQGVVRLRCMLTAIGTLERCVVSVPSGVPSLDAAAFSVARYARYSPWIINRVPVERPVILPVRWVIEE